MTDSLKDVVKIIAEITGIDGGRDWVTGNAGYVKTLNDVVTSLDACQRYQETYLIRTPKVIIRVHHSVDLACSHQVTDDILAECSLDIDTGFGWIDDVASDRNSAVGRVLRAKCSVSDQTLLAQEQWRRIL